MKLSNIYAHAFVFLAETCIFSSLITTYASGPMLNFADVSQDDYYASSIERMVQLGVVQGYENGNFGPNDPLTRAQAAIMLDRYDSRLLNTGSRMGVSGVYNLIQLMCDNGIEKSLESDDSKLIYDKLCNHAY